MLLRLPFRGGQTVLIKGNDDQSVLHERFVVQHGIHDVLQVCNGVGNIRVVGIVLEIGNVVHVLGRCRPLGDVRNESALGIDYLLTAGGVVLYVEKRHERIVFPIRMLRLLYA